MSTGEGARSGRRALVLATVTGACAAATAIVAPVVVLLTGTSQRVGAPRWVRVGKLVDLRDGEPKRVVVVADRKDAWLIERAVELGSEWLVRRGPDVVAFSAACPHLGCSVEALAVDAGDGFSCPCHTSAFGSDGKRKSGPSPRDLDRLSTRIEGGHVMIDFQRFKSGVTEKVIA